MCSHPIVVRPKEEFIALHGCRDLNTMKELAPEPVAKENGWRVVNRLPLTTINEIVATAGKLNPIHAGQYWLQCRCNSFTDTRHRGVCNLRQRFSPNQSQIPAIRCSGALERQRQAKIKSQTHARDY